MYSYVLHCSRVSGRAGVTTDSVLSRAAVSEEDGGRGSVSRRLLESTIRYLVKEATSRKSRARRHHVKVWRHRFKCQLVVVSHRRQIINIHEQISIFNNISNRVAVNNSAAISCAVSCAATTYWISPNVLGLLSLSVRQVSRIRRRREQSDNVFIKVIHSTWMISS